ncbi:tRNA epoxyqueuosine(34) reductase QueG [Cohaesibacter sp. CAU 1516]|uniref:tRNA epoxyqueuosine(34) reductase QueG n=1 Tax=Cohaesibacter sp. CAU 1516 TaxID=2576038 RepID=UPI0010FE4591|nr:tRNA epoxyqueuosine(34) reductase QueG [Cohaesibacter sp. CAU 1516]TLP43152.1 tRNA epoxyqueuosine(34) reductase QueG [Cohaesibacter sp. CAU 1516]
MTANRTASDDKLRTFLDREAKALGFADIRICRADEAANHADTLRHFTKQGYHATMGWMQETLERRAHPSALWGDVRSIIMLGFNYGPDEDPRPLLAQKDKANISVYARHRDYHDVIKGRLKQLSAKLLSRLRDSHPGGEIKVFVDTAPVMEKPLAYRAGLGWQGKHTNLVSRDFGSWIFLGAIFTNLDLPADETEVDHCGSCRACLDACPTGAFPAPYEIDARRCISYLTIEHKEPIPHEFRPAMGNRIYGCDDCLAACPWNKFAQTAAEAKLQARDDLKAPALRDFLGLDDAAFRAHFTGSPIKRIGRNRFLRNVLIAAGNSAETSLVAAIESHLIDTDPVVRGAAIWALGRLLSTQQLEQWAGRLAVEETDPYVQQEWQQALQS